MKQRKTAPVRTAADLIKAVQQAIPGKALAAARKNPATRVFQALRIAGTTGNHAGDSVTTGTATWGESGDYQLSFSGRPDGQAGV